MGECEGSSSDKKSRQHIYRDIIVLAWLTVIQFLYNLTVGLAACLEFLYAFSEEECWAWLSAVGKSVLIQLFVTDPTLGTMMLNGVEAVDGPVAAAAAM